MHLEPKFMIPGLEPKFGQCVTLSKAFAPLVLPFSLFQSKVLRVKFNVISGDA